MAARSASWWAGLLACASLAGHALWLATARPFTLDEFTYAHAGWQIASGQLPYRDFFAHHTPLLWQALAPLAAISDGAVAYLERARLVYAAVWLAQLALAYRLLAPRVGATRAWLGPIALLLTPAWLDHAVELRPDALALTLFAAALVALDRPTRRRSGLAGALVVLACWASPKVAVYGATLAPLWLAGAHAALRRGHGAGALGHPWALLAGATAALATIATWLLGHGITADFWRWAVRWPLAYEAAYEGFAWTLWLWPSLRGVELVVGLAALGWAGALAGAITQRARARSAAPEAQSAGSAAVSAALLGLAPLALASAALQSAAYPYSFLPVFFAAAHFFARAAASLEQLTRRAGPSALVRHAGALLLALALLLGGLRALDPSLRPPVGKRVGQLEVLADLQRLVRSDRPVFDATGQAVTWPSPHFYAFTNPFVRAQGGAELGERLRRAIVESGCVAVLVDLATGSYDPAFNAAIEANYQPWDGDIWLWGHAFAPGGVEVEVPVAGDYLIEPPPAQTDAFVHRIDGEAVMNASVRLSRGRHRLALERRAGVPAPSAPITARWLLWRPDDGSRWSPRFDAAPRLRHVL